MNSNDVLEHRLTGFLKHHKALEKFRKGLKLNTTRRTLHEFVKTQSFSDYCIFECAFVWSDTTSGHNFWKRLSDEWIKYLETIIFKKEDLKT